MDGRGKGRGKGPCPAKSKRDAAAKREEDSTNKPFQGKAKGALVQERAKGAPRSGWTRRGKGRAEVSPVLPGSAKEREKKIKRVKK